MNGFPITVMFERIVEICGWTLLHSLWQISLFASVYYLFRLFVVSCQIRYVVGYGLLLLSATSFPVTWAYLNQSVATGDFSSGLTGSGTHPPQTWAGSQFAGDARTTAQADYSSSRQQTTRNGNTASSLSREELGPDKRAAASSGVETRARRRPRNEGETFATNRSGQGSDHSELARFFRGEWGIANALSADNLRPALPWLVLVWFVGLLLYLARPVVGWRLTQSIRAEGVAEVSPTVKQMFDRLRVASGMRNSVSISLSERISGPMIVGYLRPILLLPPAVLTGLNSEELMLVMRHELAHVRRHDVLLGVLQTLFEAVYFFHPAFWWLSHELRNEREHCCDEAAVGDRREAITLAHALLWLAEHRQATTTAMAASGGNLQQRVARMLGVPVGEPSSSTATLVSVAGILLLALAGGLASLLSSQAYATGELSEWRNVGNRELLPAVDGESERADSTRALAARPHRAGRSEAEGLFQESFVSVPVTIENAEEIDSLDQETTWVRFAGRPDEADSSLLLRLQYRCPQLEILEFSSIPQLSNDDLELISSWTELKALRIRHADEIDERCFEELAAMRNLQLLDISYCDNLISGALIEALADHPSLEILICPTQGAEGLGEECSEVLLDETRGRLKGIYLSAEQPLAKSEFSGNSRFQIFVTGDQEDADWFSVALRKDATNQHGVQVNATISPRWSRAENIVPTIDVEVEVVDPAAFEVSGLAGKRFSHSPAAFLVELNGQLFFHPVLYLNLPTRLGGGFSMTLDLSHDRWRKLTTLPGAKQAMVDPIKLFADRYEARVWFVGFGKEGDFEQSLQSLPFVSNPIEFEVVNDDEPNEPWDQSLHGEAVSGLLLAARMEHDEFIAGDALPIDLQVINQGEQRFQFSARPSSFEVEINGQRFQSEFVFPAWYQELSPGSVAATRIDLTQQWYRDRGRVSLPDGGQSFSPGVPLELSPGDYEVQVFYTEENGSPRTLRPASQRMTFRIVDADEQVDVDVDESSRPGDELNRQDVELATQRENNWRTYRQVRDEISEQHQGQWMVIADGKLTGPFDEYQEACLESPESLHRFVFRAGLEDREFVYRTSPWANSDPSWYQFGRAFAAAERMTVSALHWQIGERNLGTPDGRGTATISVAGMEEGLARAFVISGLFEGELVIKEEDVDLLGLQKFAIPVLSRAHGSEQSREMVRCRVQISELGIDRLCVAAVVPHETISSIDTEISQADERDAIDPTAVRERNPDEWLERLKALHPGLNQREPFDGPAFRQCAAELMILDEGSRGKVLAFCASTTEVNPQVILLCRMLFTQKEENDFRAPALGGPVMAAGEAAEWPLLPLHLVDELPLLVVHGYDVGGRPESAIAYVRYCLANAEWTTAKYEPQSRQAMRDAIERHLDEDERLSSLAKYEKEFFLRQYSLAE